MGNVTAGSGGAARELTRNVIRQALNPDSPAQQFVEKLLGAAALAFRDEMREASRVEWQVHIRKASDKADRPESRAPSGFARKMPICVVALLGIVVARLRAEQVPPAKRVDATPQAMPATAQPARPHPAPRSHPRRGPCSALRGRATTFVARLASEHFSCQTRLPESSSTDC